MRRARRFKLVLLFFLGLIAFGGWLAAGHEGSMDPPSIISIWMIRVGILGSLITALLAWLCSD